MGYNDTSGQIDIQVDDVKDMKLPRVNKCDRFDHVVPTCSNDATVLREGYATIWRGGRKGGHQRDAITPQYGDMLSLLCALANFQPAKGCTIITDVSQEKEEWKN